MSDERRTLSQTNHQLAIRDWLLEFEFNIFATLTFKVEMGVSLYSAEKVYRSFAGKLNAWARKAVPPSEVMYAPIVENSLEQLQSYKTFSGERQGTHIHLLLRIPGEIDVTRNKIRNLWISTSRYMCGDPNIYSPDGNQWCIEMSTPQEREAYIGYVTKYMQNDCTGLLVGQCQLGK